MHLAVVRHLAAGLVVLLLPSLAESQTTTQKQSPSTISGTVTIKGKRAAGVTVGLRRSEMSNPFDATARATTDQDGKYRLTNVAMGSYDVMASLPAYVMADPASSARRVVIGEGENVEDINFDLVRGGVITGKITDADGRPVIQHQVNLYRANSWEQQQGAQQRPPIFPASSSNTDDRGIYRMFGVRPGRYKVAVGRGDDTFSNPSLFSRWSYKQIFYPDATDQAKATIIDVTEGSEATNVDITLGRPVQTFTASGRVVDGEKGTPVPNVRFSLNRVVSENYPFFGNFTTSNSLGEFVVDGLMPGKYSFLFIPEPNDELRPEAMPFDVLDQDVTGLIIKMARGETISGVVVLEGENRKAQARLAQAEIRAFVSNPGGPPVIRSASSPVSSDGGFRLAGLAPGIASFYLVDSRTRMRIEGVAILRIERDGVIQARGIEIKEGEHISGVRIVVSYGEATLRGTINVQNGTVPPGSHFTVRASRPGEPTPPNSAIADARGSFVIEGLAPGAFELTVSLITPDRKTRRSVKQQVNVPESGVMNVVVAFDASEPKSP
jgi:protocatechuate 3,4-dioxygenase beta subunit